MTLKTYNIISKWVSRLIGLIIVGGIIFLSHFISIYLGLNFIVALFVGIDLLFGLFFLALVIVFFVQTKKTKKNIDIFDFLISFIEDTKMKIRKKFTKKKKKNATVGKRRTSQPAKLNARKGASSSLAGSSLNTPVVQRIRTPDFESGN